MAAPGRACLSAAERLAARRAGRGLAAALRLYERARAGRIEASPEMLAVLVHQLADEVRLAWLPPAGMGPH